MNRFVLAVVFVVLLPVLAEAAKPIPDFHHQLDTSPLPSASVDNGIDPGQQDWNNKYGTMYHHGHHHKPPPCNCPPKEVPLPATLGLFGLGAGILGMWRRFWSKA